MPLTPGVRLGAYEVSTLIGAGGMGNVYRARDTNDLALLAPPINTNPGPEYAPATRTQQGVASIERTTKGRLWAAWNVGPYGDPATHAVPVNQAVR